MEFVVTEISGVTKASLTGRLDTSNIDKVETSFTASILPKAQNTAIDLTQVTFIASLGIRMLLTIARTLSQRGAQLAMYGALPNVYEIIETTALSDIIPLYTSEEEAIAALSA